jgi:hypothetical protein
LTGSDTRRYAKHESWGYTMIFAPLFGTALTLAVATGPLDSSGHETRLSAQEKMAATEPLIRSATDCIVHAVSADPRYSEKPSALGDLIVASMPACVTPVRAMIDAYDRYYGEGSGEAFFMGPYLDVLPKAVMDGASKEAK